MFKAPIIVSPALLIAPISARDHAKLVEKSVDLAEFPIVILLAVVSLVAERTLLLASGVLSTFVNSRKVFT